jgi:hypothetical protein
MRDSRALELVNGSEGLRQSGLMLRGWSEYELMLDAQGAAIETLLITNICG